MQRVYAKMRKNKKNKSASHIFLLLAKKYANYSPISFLMSSIFCVSLAAVAS